MSIKLVLFDLSGVVFNNFNKQQFIEDMNLKISLEQFKKTLYTKEYFDKLESQYTTKEEFAKYFKDKLSSPLSLDEIIYNYTKNLGNINLSSFNAFNSLKNKGLKVGILSNISYVWANEIDFVIKCLNPDYVFYSYKIGICKPDDEIYKYVLKNVPFKAEEILFLDDKQENVKAALKNGFNSSLVSYNKMFDILKVLENFL